MKDARQLIDELSAASLVLSDISQQTSSRDEAEAIVQALMAHVHSTLETVRQASKTHRLNPSFHGFTLRHAEDSEASYQLEDGDFTIEPKFIADSDWESSSNCSDQGLALFREDFTRFRDW